MNLSHKDITLQLHGDRDKIIEEYISTYADSFKEWYAPVTLGNHKIYARTHPTFQWRADSINDNTLGKLKWDYIIKDNLPDLKDKKICDLGCNIGLFSLEMGKLGAIIDGFDRGPNTNIYLGSQSVANQAYFVRNLYEVFYKARYPYVNFHEVDLMTCDLGFLKEYDLLFSCCTLYHLGAQRMDQIIEFASKHIPEVFLQSNDLHGGNLGKISNIDYHIKLLEKYNYKIKKIVRIPGYPHSIIYAIQ